MGRPLRVIQTEYPYHLLCRTNNRTFRFNKRQITRIFFKAITEGTEKYKILVHHVVLMSNHYHIVATATEQNIHRFMQYVNSRIAFRYNRTVGRTGHLWGDRYKSCIIDTDEYYLACVRYIYRNPKRARIVEDLQDFEESSLQFWAFGKKVGTVLVEDHLVRLQEGAEENVQDFFRDLVIDEGLGILSEQSTKIGLRKQFFGSADFIQRMSRIHQDYKLV